MKQQVFVPYRGFYFLNTYNQTFKGVEKNLFSSPIGAFIFLIRRYRNCKVYVYVFVPYRGFYFLNRNLCLWSVNSMVFSSPIGAFIFLIKASFDDSVIIASVFVPYRGFYFLNPGLAILVFMRVKKMFCGVNLF